MDIKNFIFPTFEEWCENNRTCEIVLGAYKVTIESFCWSSNYIEYMFAVALKNTVPSNIYTSRFFQNSFKYEIQMPVDVLKKWYENIIKEFNDWWIEHIYTTYFMEE